MCSILLVAGGSVACGGKEHPSSVGDGASSAGSGNVTSNAGSGDFNIGVGGGNTGSGGNSGGLTDACAADVKSAEPVPLDIYLMLDVSSSMLDATATGPTKWDSVKAALEAFLKDPASAGLGVGLQYFPLPKANAPTSCTSDAECGDSGPCLLKACYNYYRITGKLVSCQLASDCVEPTSGTDFGPCLQASQSSVCAHATSCDAGLYRAPARPIAALPGASAALIASIDSKVPLGNTPTAPALSGAIQQASAWATAHPDHRVVTVLATDGLPTECTPTDIASVAGIAQAGVSATPSIKTFVIGVFGPTDVQQGAPDNLNQIAQEGGTTSAFIVDTQKDVTTQFLAALDTIRGGHLACQFQIPSPMSNESLDYNRVNVQFTSGTQTSTIFYVRNQAACDPNTGGWYYDVDPTVSAPSRIIACPTSCASFQSVTGSASVGIALGCQTVVK